MLKVVIDANKCRGQSTAAILGYYLRTDPDQVELKGVGQGQAQEMKTQIEATGRKVAIKS